jgi:hypothetical protein
MSLCRDSAGRRSFVPRREIFSMSGFLALLWPFLTYWLIVFVACYVVVEYAQNYLYDETTPSVGLKILLGSMILAVMLTWTRSSFDTMFISELPKTILQGIVWFAVFTLVFRFQPQHGAAIGIVTMVLLAGMATLGVESLTKSNRQTLPATRRTSRPLRQPAFISPPKQASSQPAESGKAPSK